MVTGDSERLLFLVEGNSCRRHLLAQGSSGRATWGRASRICTVSGEAPVDDGQASAHTQGRSDGESRHEFRDPISHFGDGEAAARLSRRIRQQTALWPDDVPVVSWARRCVRAENCASGARPRWNSEHADAGLRVLARSGLQGLEYRPKVSSMEQCGPGSPMPYSCWSDSNTDLSGRSTGQIQMAHINND